MSEAPTKHLCPYCGSVGDRADRCAHCGGQFDALSLQATQVAMGPWFVRDPAKPHHPGCSYEVLRKRINAGKISADSIIRGPTTHQFWDLARRVPGVAHLVGYCHACEARTGGAGRCVKCGQKFVAPAHRNELGLTYPLPDDAAVAHQVLSDAPVRHEARPATPTSTLAGPPPTGPGATGLLGGVLTTSAAGAPGEEPEPEPPQRRLGRGAWALIALNVLILAAIAYFLFVSGNDAPAIESTESTPSQSE